MPTCGSFYYGQVVENTILIFSVYVSSSTMRRVRSPEDSQKPLILLRMQDLAVHFGYVSGKRYFELLESQDDECRSNLLVALRSDSSVKDRLALTLNATRHFVLVVDGRNTA